MPCVTQLSRLHHKRLRSAAGRSRQPSNTDNVRYACLCILRRADADLLSGPFARVDHGAGTSRSGSTHRQCRLGGGGNGGGGGGGSGGTPAIGIQNGYSASTGYDLATGLGSVNVENLIAAHGFAAAPDVNIPPPTPVAPALLRRMEVRDWQPALRAIAITFVFCSVVSSWASGSDRAG